MKKYIINKQQKPLQHEPQIKKEKEHEQLKSKQKLQWEQEREQLKQKLKREREREQLKTKELRKSKTQIQHKGNNIRQITVSKSLVPKINDQEERTIVINKKRQPLKRNYFNQNDIDTDDTNDLEEFDSQDGGANVYTSIAKSGYKKPKGPSKQDQLTLDQIRKKLRGYKELNTMKDKEVLQYIQPFRSWIRYYDKKQQKFRIGGLLMKTEYPEYITLVNTANNISWSVQLKDNIIYIPDTAKIKEPVQQKTERTEMTGRTDRTEIVRTERTVTERSESKIPDNQRVEMIKEKLYELFLDGKLKVLK